MNQEISTKELILQSAKELFLQKGYDATPLQEIMKATGVSKGGIYHHFSSKDEIFSELVISEVQPLLEGARTIFEDTSTPIKERLLAWMNFKNQFYIDKYSLLRRVFVEQCDISIRFRIINQIKGLIKPIIETALEKNTEVIPHLKETVGLLLCSHELIFSYWLSDIQDEVAFEENLETMSYIFRKIFA